ncbi:hypothetical protein BGZ61DRAFT_567809 [Ilyonectria robusta]|uniref:uncharacterized protein n=1 Tax=Ilyonectria robusta TaxID=1079257 RepID=UPI001E8D363C|nr:uncharacterized protein BGZ61DRAFT_567809 [Ilyonectria robusta]KAH8657229.1 hypothetical protein BGZ61DRAFT_567809 [Ilyonectria robusta]
MDSDNPPQKTIRSHEQNQERAYIAASRRGDRSIEARLQSARRASEVHKLWTGKALCVSRDIVLKEEIYEEVDDVFPRSYQLRGLHQRQSSVIADSQEGEDPKSPLTTTELASGDDQQLHETEVNSDFAQCFPEVDQILSRRWSTQSILMVSPPQRGAFQNSLSKLFDSAARDISYTQGAVLDAESRSLSDSPPPELRRDVELTPPRLANEFKSFPATPRSQAAGVFGQVMPIDSIPVCNGNCDESALTADLPPEANKLLVDGEIIDPALYDQQWMGGTAPSGPYAVDMDMEKDDFSELYEDGLNMMSWDPVSWPKTSTDGYSWNMFQNGNMFENDLSMERKDSSME